MVISERIPTFLLFVILIHKIVQTLVIIVDSVITYTLSPLCKLVNVRLMEAPEPTVSYATSVNIFSDFTIKCLPFLVMPGAIRKSHLPGLGVSDFTIKRGAKVFLALPKKVR